MLYTYALEICDGKQFVFEFTFENSSEQNCDTQNSHEVSYKLYRRDKPDNTYTWNGCLSSDSTIPFELLYEDQVNIKGTMTLYKGMQRAFIWIDTSYCYELSRHFEGNIIEIPNE